MMRSTHVLRALAIGCGLALASVAYAQDSGPIDPYEVIASVSYGLLGIVLSIVGYKAFEYVLPFDVTHELSVDDNPAVGVVMAAVILGVSIIMAAAIVD